MEGWVCKIILSVQSGMEKPIGGVKVSRTKPLGCQCRIRARRNTKCTIFAYEDRPGSTTSAMEILGRETNSGSRFPKRIPASIVEYLYSNPFWETRNTDSDKTLREEALELARLYAASSKYGLDGPEGEDDEAYEAAHSP